MQHTSKTVIGCAFPHDNVGCNAHAKYARFDSLLMWALLLGQISDTRICVTGKNLSVTGNAGGGPRVQ